MIQSRKNLLHGCRVPRTVILSVLSVEYIILFYSSLQRLQGILLFIGYFLLTVAITCNNHGRNVQVKYEQELTISFMTRWNSRSVVEARIALSISSRILLRMVGLPFFSASHSP